MRPGLEQAAASRSAVRRIDSVRFADLIRAEWVKLISIPSLMVGLGALVVLSIGLPLIVAVATPGRGLPDHTIDQTVYGLLSFPATFTTVLAGVLGVLVMGAEYSTGSMQTSMLTAPRRTGVLMAKALLMLGITTALALVSVIAAWVVTYPLFASANQEVALSTPGLPLAMLGAAFSVGLCAPLGVGVAAVLRSTTAGALAIAAVTFGAMVLASLLPAGIIRGVANTLVYGPAAYRMVEIRPDAVQLDLASGQAGLGMAWLVVALWAVAAVAVGAAVLKCRDV